MRLWGLLVVPEVSRLASWRGQRGKVSVDKPQAGLGAGCLAVLFGSDRSLDITNVERWDKWCYAHFSIVFRVVIPIGAELV